MLKAALKTLPSQVSIPQAVSTIAIKPDIVSTRGLNLLVSIPQAVSTIAM